MSGSRLEERLEHNPLVPAALTTGTHWYLLLLLLRC